MQDTLAQRDYLDLNDLYKQPYFILSNEKKQEKLVLEAYQKKKKRCINWVLGERLAGRLVIIFCLGTLGAAFYYFFIVRNRSKITHLKNIGKQISNYTNSSILPFLLSLLKSIEPDINNVSNSNLSSQVNRLNVDPKDYDSMLKNAKTVSGRLIAWLIVSIYTLKKGDWLQKIKKNYTYVYIPVLIWLFYKFLPLANKLIQPLQECVMIILELTGFTHYYDVLEQAEQRYIINAHRMSKGLRKSGLDMIYAARINSNKEVEAIAFIDKLTALPNRIKRVYYDEEAINEEFKYYNPEIQHLARTICFRIVLFTELLLAGKQNLLNNIVRFTFYLKGEPGLGKTAFVHKIAKVLRLPVAEPRLQGGQSNSLYGSMKKASTIAEACTNAAGPEGLNNYKNMLLLIDEGDRLLHDKMFENYMLKLIDPTNTVHPIDSFFNTTFDLPFFIILVGNTELQDIAIKNRVEEILFPAISPANKRAIAKDILLVQLLEICSAVPIYGVPKEELFNVKVQSKFWEIVEEDIREGKDPGMRTIQKKVSDLLFNELKKLYLKKQQEALSN